MKPSFHVLFTVLAYFVINFFHHLDFEVLYWAVFLTLAVDVVDHCALILNSQHPMIYDVRKLISEGKVKNAYRLYYENRRRIVSFALLHNLPMFFLLLYLSIHFKNPVLALGLVLHYMLDMMDHYQHEGNLKFWMGR